VEQPAPELDPQPPRPPREARNVSGSRRRYVRWVARAVVVAVVFLLGLVVGRALQDAPRPGGQQTGVRTLEPSTLAPVETVTVTVAEP
jgi:hypothetical protein